MLEILVHWKQPSPPPDYVVVVMFVPDSLVSKNVLDVGPDWRLDQQWCKEAGDAWLAERKNLLLRVPSVIAPSEANYLINPLHTDAGALKISDVEPFNFDKRIFWF